MNKTLSIIIVTIIFVIVAGFGYLLLSDSSDKPSDNPQPSTQQTSQEPTPQAEQSAVSGSYTTYSEESLANADGQRVLFFHAPWCPQCRELEESIQSGAIPSDVTIFKVDYDSNQALRQQYGVTLQTTVVLIDDEGNEVKKYVAYDEPSLQAIIENLL